MSEWSLRAAQQFRPLPPLLQHLTLTASRSAVLLLRARERERKQLWDTCLKGCTLRKIRENKNFPDPPTLALLKKSKGNTEKKTRVFLFAEPLKSLGIERKTPQKSKENRKRKKARKSRKKTWEGQGWENLVVCNSEVLFCALVFALFCRHLRSFALICVFLRPTAFRTTAFGNCRKTYPPC